MRECNGCTACCFYLDVPEISKTFKAACQHAVAGAGCQIHDTKPAKCKGFRCAWLAGIGRESERPDKLGLMPIVDENKLVVYEVKPGAWGGIASKIWFSILKKSRNHEDGEIEVYLLRHGQEMASLLGSFMPGERFTSHKK